MTEETKTYEEDGEIDNSKTIKQESVLMYIIVD